MKAFRIFVDLAMPPAALALLKAGTAGHELVFPKQLLASVLAGGEIDPKFATADIAFGQPNPEAVAATDRLKWAQISSSGITRYDTPEFRALAAQKKVVVTNSASVYDDACAVQVLSFMLAQARKLPAGLKIRTPNGSPAWQALRQASGTLHGESVLSVGYGAIGRRLAELLQPLGMRLTAYRRTPRGDEGLPVITGDRLQAALGEADHIVNILPASTETRHFFNRARLESIKPGAIFYNIGRGTTVDQAALAQALHSGHLGAAWLDVTEPEPLPDDHPLWAEPNCFITPHTAGGHKDESQTLVRHFLNNFDRFVSGQPLLDRVM
jgi:phosphoglycerate dehydrogenase-like enzyme